MKRPNELVYIRNAPNRSEIRITTAKIARYSATFASTASSSIPRLLDPAAVPTAGLIATKRNESVTYLLDEYGSG